MRPNRVGDECEDRGDKGEAANKRCGSQDKQTRQGDLHFWSFQVTVGSGRPTARQ